MIVPTSVPSNIECKESHRFLLDDKDLARNERKTFWVIVISALMMGVEIVSGYLTGSMALLADGWHMASHVGALTISFLVYRLSRSKSVSRHFSFGAGKLLPLGGYTSAILLAVIAVAMCVESVTRFSHPRPIDFLDALWVAVAGLIVNLVSAWILGLPTSGHSHDHGHDHRHEPEHRHGHDHNLKSAYAHVLSDAFTSILAIIALIVGKWQGVVWLDPAMGIFGGLIILVWSYNLCRETALELLDAHSNAIDMGRLKALLEAQGSQIVDFHVWRVAPKAVACELIVEAEVARGTEFYRNLLQREFHIHHIVIEERTLSGRR